MTIKPTDDAVMKAAAPKLEALKKAAHGIESIFFKDMLNAMQKSVAKTHFGQSSGGEIYQDMFNQAVAENAGKSGALGIADLLYRQLSPKLISQARAELMTQAANDSTTSGAKPGNS